MVDLQVIILAAGEGTRMKSDTAKVLHKVAGKEMILHVLDAVKNITNNKPCIVVGHNADDVCNKINDDVCFVKQEEQLGTGHAVLSAIDYIKDEGNVLILYGDTPLITEETINLLLKYHDDNKLDVTVATMILDNPFGYGRIIKEDNKFKKIVEQKDTTEEENLIKEVNTGIYCFNASALKLSLSKLNNNNNQNEYYLTDTLEILLNNNYKIGTMLSYCCNDFYGINSREQLAHAEKLMRNKINKNLMDSGVTLIDPEHTYIDQEVQIGKDTIIYPNVIIEGKTVIGKGCILRSNTRISNCIIKDYVNIDNSVLLDSKIDEKTNIGPFAYIRPNSDIGKNTKIGDFVEVKNTKIGNNTKVAHLSYLGDSELGENINIGCGTVTVNYDGKNKFKTIIKDNSFIGCNSNLVAPVTIEENSYIAAGSTITENVEKNALAIARARQINKLNWHKK